ncbi:hypothetical protein BpHYR1_012883 [Brachionus plicatilis]|uniref:Uncharacterized protein n=1 Tax=Brachionus plicatilis TaxID=10195 RepID=A0A3M7QGW8_BRAPC|nr:hypothetical protein BpHYR1_012883 [Brachionus plicatilis]
MSWPFGQVGSSRSSASTRAMLSFLTFSFMLSQKEWHIVIGVQNIDHQLSVSACQIVSAGNVQKVFGRVLAVQRSFDHKK